MYWYKSYFIEVILLSFMWKLLAIMGLGTSAFLLYEKMNPECCKDMKESINKMTDKASNKVKNMME